MFNLYNIEGCIWFLTKLIIKGIWSLDKYKVYWLGIEVLFIVAIKLKFIFKAPISKNNSSIWNALVYNYKPLPVKPPSSIIQYSVS